MSGISNINSVILDDQGGLTIIGEIADLQDYDLGESLIHVWLAQPGVPGQPGGPDQPEVPAKLGAGLAIDCIAAASAAPGAVCTVFTKNSFTLTVPSSASRASGVVGTFFKGPAIVSVLAVLVEQGAQAGTVAQVLQWSRIAMLPEDAVVDAAKRPTSN
jgi:hypothetical protein